MKQELNRKAFIKSIRQKRIIEEDIDMRELGKRLDINASTICRIENGATPGVEVYATLCKWLGEPMNKFIKAAKA